MNLHRVQKKGYKLSSQKYEQETTDTYKNNKTVLLENKSPFNCMMKGKLVIPKITSPDMMKKCGVIDECPDYTPLVVMEDFVND